jgi:hypothetical protein
MRRCGVLLETVKAERGLTVRYVFTGKEVLRNMQYCIVEAGGAVRMAHTSYWVPAGTIGWTNSEGTEVVLQECFNGAECVGCTPPPPPPAPPVVAPPPPILEQTKQELPPSPPACLASGSMETGFSVTAFNGTVLSLLVDGNPYTTDDPLPSGPGTHTFEARVSGVGPDAVCKRVWEVLPPPLVINPPEEEEAIGYCEDGNSHHWYGWPRVQVECHPVRTTAIICGGTFIASLITHVPIPPCGWFRHQTPAVVPEKPNIPTIHKIHN